MGARSTSGSDARELIAGWPASATGSPESAETNGVLPPTNDERAANVNGWNGVEAHITRIVPIGSTPPISGPVVAFVICIGSGPDVQALKGRALHDWLSCPLPHARSRRTQEARTRPAGPGAAERRGRQRVYRPEGSRPPVATWDPDSPKRMRARSRLARPGRFAASACRESISRRCCWRQ